MHPGGQVSIDVVMAASAAEVIAKALRGRIKGRPPLSDDERRALEAVVGDADSPPLELSTTARSRSRSGIGCAVLVVVVLGALVSGIVYAQAPPWVGIVIIGGLVVVGVLALVGAVLFGGGGPGATPAPQGDDDTTAVALAIGSEEFFRRARRRVNITFWIQMVIALIILAFVLGGLGGFIAGLIGGAVPLAAGSGGTSVVGILAGLLVKPQAGIRSALADAQTWDLIIEACRDGLKKCQQLATTEAKINCARRAWKSAIKSAPAK